ncbi:hypothetical protein BDW75DRAFT_248673 [Aspergillus navahoensis]
MASRVFVSVVAVLVAVVAIYYQELLTTCSSQSPDLKVGDSARDITYLGSLSPAGEIEHLQNIFYAEEPTGQRRFAAPVPTRPVKGSVIDATLAPAGTKRDAKLPVVVWIHGGGHALGSASDILYEPDGFEAAADRLPLVYVGINYRLGFFGFATGGALMEKKDTNAGLRDQRAALELSVIGQSVGASDIGLQLTAFGGDQDVPFQQRVMMSGGPGLNFNSQPDLVASTTAAIAQQVGCGDIKDLQALECLRGVPFEQLTNLSVTASRAARPPFGEGYFYPTIDGIPFIASWVANDGAWYAPPATVTDDEVLGSFGLWLPNLSGRTKKQLLQLYPPEDFKHMIRPEHEGRIPPQYYRAAQLNRDIWFTCPVLDFTWQYVKAGGVGASQVRLYEFNETRYTPVFDYMGVSMWGAAHLSDIPYLFYNDHLGRMIIQFVHGSPKRANDRLRSWPPAFSNDSSKSSTGDVPSHISVQLFDGPYGSVPVRCSKGNGAADVEVMTAAEKALHWEQLFSRCAFLNGQQFREEAGV